MSISERQKAHVANNLLHLTAKERSFVLSFFKEKYQLYFSRLIAQMLKVAILLNVNTDSART